MWKSRSQSDLILLFHNCFFVIEFLCCHKIINVVVIALVTGVMAVSAVLLIIMGILVTMFFSKMVDSFIFKVPECVQIFIICLPNWPAIARFCD